jgi:hypothetical protein
VIAFGMSLDQFRAYRQTGTSHAVHERLTKRVALAVFASDASRRSPARPTSAIRSARCY